MPETSANKLKEKAPMTDWTLPRNLARSTTPAIAPRSNRGLYHHPNTPPLAPIRTASLIGIRIQSRKFIDISHTSWCFT